MRRLFIVVLFVSFVSTAFAFYNPGQGRWMSRDPIGEVGGLNLYQFSRNAPVNWVDRNGLDIWIGGPKRSPHQNINIGDPNSGNPDSYTYGLVADSFWAQVNEMLIFAPWRSAEVYKDFRSPSPKSRCIKTTPEQDKEARELLDAMVGECWGYGLTGGNCRDFSKDMFDFFSSRFEPQRNPRVLITTHPSFNIWRNTPTVYFPESS